jgi:hypothetical protein
MGGLLLICARAARAPASEKPAIATRTIAAKILEFFIK